jgi:hypothetical protein
MLGSLGRVFALLAAAQFAGGSEPSDKVDFLRDVRPIFAEHCWKCHGREKPESGLSLTSRDAVLAAAEGGRVIVVPGKPQESELMRRVLASDDERMPPHDEKPLTAQQIDTLRRWIEQGAPWKNHWSLEPLRSVVPPPVRDASWVRNDIDRFVLAALEERGWKPSQEADRYTLIRRLSYDLLGLPPAVEEVDAFVQDTSPQAYEHLVDRLLASPHFGERWGRHWLDLAHYADSDGYEKDQARPDAYRFRDWVIQAINEDMPFDRFSIEQLAGDLLPNSTAHQRLATAFLRQTLTNEEGGVDQEEFRIAANFDRTETVSTVWLGLTMNCARCHDHKYDPLTQRDYYQLFAFFNNSEEVTTPLPVEGNNLSEYERRLAPLEQALAQRYRELAPAEQQWEKEEHQTILAQPEGVAEELPVTVLEAVSVQSPKARFVIDDKGIFRELSESDGETVALTDTYLVTVSLPAIPFTGLKVYCLADSRLPHKGPGWANDGNFVLTGLRAVLVDRQGKEQTVALHRVRTSYAQAALAADSIVASSPEAGRKSGGWGVGGKTGQDHWIEARTYEAIAVEEGTRLRLELDQHFGDRHLLGRFRIAVFAGGARGLHLDNAEIAGYLEMYPEKRVARMRQKLFEYYVTEVVRDETVKRLHAQMADLNRQFSVTLQNVRTIGLPLLPRQSFVFHRGEFLAPTVPVSADVPAVLPPLQRVTSGEEANRLDLAHWLFHPENPLTARVAVNHVWQHLFGVGLVRTPTDFGVRGDLPTHPDLLDWLADQFRGPLGWSRKKLIRLIVCSATYRQSSARRQEYEELDPENRLLFRQNRFRVEAEVVRDVHLKLAGLLSAKIGGPSVFPPMPEDLAALSYANNFTWKTSTGPDRYRRGMYTFFKRTIPHPNLMTFDAPDANLPCVQRTVSNTPLQALLLLNNEVHLEAAQALSCWVCQQPAITAARDMDAHRLTALWRRCVARPPERSELATLQQLLDAARHYYAEHAQDAEALLTAHRAAEVPVTEQAAWMVVARTILNLDEVITRE